MSFGRIALSFDVEDWYHTNSISGSSNSLYKDLEEFHRINPHAEDCITEATITIIKILKNLDVKATFFVVADMADKYSAITKALKESSHEIASHSLTHQSAFAVKTKEMFKPVEDWIGDQIAAKKKLEDTFEKEVIGFRAPNAYFANWMVKPLQEIGFKYDSSITYNSLYNKTNVTLKNIPIKPYYINSHSLSYEEADTTLVELPWSNLKLTKNIYFPAGGAYFFRLFGYNYFEKVIAKALRTGDTMFYLHPLDISRKKIPLSNTKHRPLFWINKGEKTEKNLIRLLKRYRNVLRPCSDIYERYVNEG